MKIHLTHDQLIDAGRVVAFAKSHGFPDAIIIYWDENHPDYGKYRTEGLLEDGESINVVIGIAFNAPPMRCHREKDEGFNIGPVICDPTKTMNTEKFKIDLEAKLADLSDDDLRTQMVNATMPSSELADLRDAVRACLDAKGRYHTQLAFERLLTFLPENYKILP